MRRNRRYFGTDGVRGIYGEDLTEELVESIGLAFGRWSGARPVLVGRDTRASGPALEAALVRGLSSAGAAAILGGVLPTPAVALLADGPGAVVSASHNPAVYNGVKLFRGGWKLSDSEEEEIEELLEERPEDFGGWISTRDGSGLAARYVDLVCGRFGAPLGGLRIAVDCANGAMSDVAPTALERLGATVVAVANEPDGSNINLGCGATDLSLLSRVALDERADLGVAFDGDGDRMLAVSAAGEPVDGDQIVAILALHLGVSQVAVTSMTNLGFHRLMAERGIRVRTTDVGDRYVLEALRKHGGVLGGEQSGHVVYLEGHTTGDGLVAAILLARSVVESGKSLAELAAVMSRFPQAKENVPVRTKALSERVRAAVDRANAELGVKGRVLVRPSGTEPLVRVLVEAEREEIAADLCATIGRLIAQEQA